MSSLGKDGDVHLTSFKGSSKSSSASGDSGHVAGFGYQQLGEDESLCGSSPDKDTLFSAETTLGGILEESVGSVTSGRLDAPVQSPVDSWLSHQLQQASDNYAMSGQPSRQEIGSVQEQDSDSFAMGNQPSSQDGGNFTISPAPSIASSTNRFRYDSGGQLGDYPASLRSSSSSLAARGGGIPGTQRVYIPSGATASAATQKTSDSPSVLRRLALINSNRSRSNQPRPQSDEIPQSSSGQAQTRASGASTRYGRSVRSYRSMRRPLARNSSTPANIQDYQAQSEIRRNVSSPDGFKGGQINPSFVDDGVILRPGDLGPRGMGNGEMGEDESFVDDMVVIERPIYTQSEFDEGFEAGKRPKSSMKTWARGKASKCECTGSCLWRYVKSWFPFLGIMSEYKLPGDLIADMIAGLTVGIMHIPQGMAYGQLSTLPPVYGLYVSFFPVILYYFLGTSKHVSIGTFAVVSLMVGSAVEKNLADHEMTLQSWNETVVDENNETVSVMMDNSEEIVALRLKLAMGITFAVGVLQFLLGVLQLGFMTVYLSDPLISGFTTGAACHVFSSQVKNIFGISVGSYSGAWKLIYTYRDVFTNLPKTNSVTLIASLVCIVVLILVKEYINNHPKIKPKLKMPVPIELIVVVAGTVISYFVKLEEKYDIQIVGEIPVGMPVPNLDAFTYLTQVFSDSFAIAIVSFAISVSMCKIFANKHDYVVDANQELIAYGACNVVSSFFSSFVSAVSLSRSLIQENAGCKTQVTGLVSSSLLLVVLLVIGPYFETLPNCILSSIILVALKGMFKQFGDLKTLWKVSIIDFTVWLVSFFATILLDVDLGLLVGVIYALLTVIMRSQRPYSCILGQVPGTDIYKDISVYKVAEESPNIKIFRFDSALFFANCEFFKASLYKLTVDPNDLKEKQRKLTKKRKKEEKDLLNVTVTAESSTLKNGNKDISNPVMTEAAPGSINNAEDGASSNSTKDTFSNLTDVHYIIIDCSTIGYVDSMGVKTLKQIITDLKAYKITVYLAQCKSSVREMFESTGFYNTGSRHYMFVTIHDAVVSAQLNQWSILQLNMEEAIEENEDEGDVEDGITGKTASAAGGNNSIDESKKVDQGACSALDKNQSAVDERTDV